MVRDIKIAHFDPGSDGICPGVCLSRIFEKIAIYGIFGPFFGKCVYIFLYIYTTEKWRRSGEEVAEKMQIP